MLVDVICSTYAHRFLTATVNQTTAAEGEGTAQGNVVLEGRVQERADLSLRHTSTVATWNIRGMGTGKLNIITREMEELDIMVLGIAEHWMLGQGKFITESGHTMVYSGKEEGRSRQGVGFILNKSASRALIGYNPISPRVISLRLKAHPLNISIVQVYAPTSDAAENEAESFYESLQETLDCIPPRDMLMIIGDWNAKVDKLQQKSSHVGTNGLGTQNERGALLMEFCAGTT